MKSFNIAGREIGAGHPTFIIAELSANHNHNFDVAVKTLEAAAAAGADAIKLQTYTPDTITLDADNEYFQIKSGTLWDGKTLYQLYGEAYTPWDWQPKLKEVAEKLGLPCFSSPFDPSAVDFLENMGVPAYKVASFEITDIPLIRYIAQKGKPIIISTGIAEWEEIGEAVQACRDEGNDQIAVLKCTSAYPARIEDANLSMIPKFRDSFDIIPGLSDHTLGITVPVVSVALGAAIIEKHLILDKELGGPDAAFSLAPAEFGAMVKAVREAEVASGDGVHQLSEKSRKNRVFSRSLFVVQDVAAGEALSAENVRSIRPGYGMAPKHLPDVLGKVATRDLKRGEPLQADMIGEVHAG